MIGISYHLTAAGITCTISLKASRKRNGPEAIGQLPGRKMRAPPAEVRQRMATTTNGITQQADKLIASGRNMPEADPRIKYAAGEVIRAIHMYGFSERAEKVLTQMAKLTRYANGNRALRRWKCENGTIFCFIKARNLAKILGCTDRNIRYAIREAREAGLVEYKKCSRSTGAYVFRIALSFAQFNEFRAEFLAIPSTRTVSDPSSRKTNARTRSRARRHSTEWGGPLTERQVAKIACCKRALHGEKTDDDYIRACFPTKWRASREITRLEKQLDDINTGPTYQGFNEEFDDVLNDWALGEREVSAS